MTQFFGGFWLRVVASVIDSFILVGMGLGWNYFKKAPLVPNAVPELKSFLFQVGFGITLSIFYYSILQGMMKGSVGKHLMGLTLLDAKSYKQITFSQSVSRYLMSFISYTAFFLGVMTVGWDKKRQGWHDKVAGTVVVKKKYLKNLTKRNFARPAVPSSSNPKAA